VAGLLWNALSSSRLRGARLSNRLQEHQALAEEEYDANARVNAELQSANVELLLKLSELTALHDLSVATQATLLLDEVLDQSLATLVDHLSFERALVMLVDTERGVLTGGRSRGGSEEQSELLAQLEISLSNPDALFTKLLRSDEAVLSEHLDQSEDEATRTLARSLGASSVLGTPLVTKGERVGILAVDNGNSGRPMSDTDRQLLFSAGNLVAGAIGSARLYEAVERQNESLRREVRELRIEIDDSRKSEQVAEITGSEYFQDLRRQALELRGALGVAGVDPVDR
jgi:GAF domain-containing protein